MEGADQRTPDDSLAERIHATIRLTPSAAGTSGSQPRRSWALVMTGRRRVGSSTGSGRYSMGEDDPVIWSTIFANSPTVNSSGFPRLIGPVSEDLIIAAIPRI